MNDLDVLVEKYFQDLGVKEYKNILQFWSGLDEEYGLTRARQLESAYIKLEEGDEESFYTTIYEEFDVALAFASLRIDLYRNFVNWFIPFVEKHKSDATIVDIGCGNAVLTCLTALALPETQIKGFDISSQGIKCATKLKHKLQLKNVEFFQADTNQIPEQIIDCDADIAISVAALDPDYKSSPSAQLKNSSISEKWTIAQSASVPQSIKQIGKLLNKSGALFVSFDKLITDSQKLDRISAIQKSGFGLDTEESTWLTYTDIQSELITLPILVAKFDGPACNELMAVAFLLSESSHENKLDLTECQKLTAEIGFTYINPKEFIKGARADYRDGTGSVWHEVWQAGPLVLILEHTNHGYRGLSVCTSPDTTAAIESHLKWIDSSKPYADVVTLDKPDIEFQPLKSDLNIECH